MVEMLYDEHGQEVMATRRPKAQTSRFVGLGVTLALVLGGLGLYAAKRNKMKEPRVSAASASAPAVEVPAAPPPPVDLPGRAAVWLPETPEERVKLLEDARFAVTAYEDPLDQESWVWMRTWSLRHPGALRPGDHPSLDLAMRMVDATLSIVRDEQRRSAAQRANLDSAIGLESAPSPVELVREPPREAPPAPAPEVSEVPCPGHYYEVCEGQELTGPAGIATGALLIAGLEAGCAQGWSREDTEARATELAHHPQAQAIYVKLIADCEENVGKLEPLRPGTLLWLPPLPEGTLVGAPPAAASGWS